LREQRWNQVKYHLGQFAVPNRRFANVESVTLVGEEWLPIVNDDRFKELEEAIEKRDITIVKRFFE